MGVAGEGLVRRYKDHAPTVARSVEDAREEVAREGDTGVGGSSDPPLTVEALFPGFA